MLSKIRNLNIMKFPESCIYVKAPNLLHRMLGGAATQRIYFSAWMGTAMPCMASAVPPDNPAHSVFGKQIKVEK
jgi:hypothetical protein